MLRTILVVTAMVVVTLAAALPLLPSARSVHTAAFRGAPKRFPLHRGGNDARRGHETCLGTQS